ncbi:MAG TPA: prepilin-type N-terminal cleavage/methylation domain-containing protein [Sedimentisphaerales bacterium]|nr:prepilin-type N-terminal cleavage/methylation domain-containing protein [Sedimentisphaerales bacterium]
MFEKRTTNRNRKGFTLVELMVTTIFLGIIVLGAGVVVTDSQRGWNATYNRIYSDVVVGSHLAGRVFDSVVRRASANNIVLGETRTWVEVRYYQTPDSAVVDGYARFYRSGGDLKVEYGSLDPREALTTHTVCSNVSSCVFMVQGTSVQMILRLNNGSETATVVSSAIAHN